MIGEAQLVLHYLSHLRNADINIELLPGLYLHGGGLLDGDGLL